MPGVRVIALALQGILLLTPLAARGEAAQAAPAQQAPADQRATAAPEPAPVPPRKPAAASEGAQPPAAAPPAEVSAEPAPASSARATWRTALVVGVVLLALAALVLLGWLIWRRRRAAGPRPTSGPSIDHQLASVARHFFRYAPARAHHLPTVLVMGDAGAGKSHLIGSRVDWRSQANQFHPSALDDSLLQLYLGSDVVVHELSATLLRDLSQPTRRALTRLWRGVGPSVTAVVVVDARTLSVTPPQTLRELAQLVRGKLSALPARQRGELQLRVCLTHLDQLEGYDELVAVLGPHHDPIDVSQLLTDGGGGSLLAAARAIVATYDANLAYGLTNRKSDAFARLVSFYAAFPVLLTHLAPLLQALRGDDPDQPHFPAAGLYLSALVPDSHVGDPFVVNPDLVASSITRQQQLHRRGALATVAVGLAVVTSVMAWHRGDVRDAEQASRAYRAQVLAGRPTSERHVREVSRAMQHMHEGESLWLDHTFVERKRVLRELFAGSLRKQYLLPMLHVTSSNRSRMLYVVALVYASEANGLRSLARDNVDLWVTKLGIPSLVVSTYLDAVHEQYQTAEQFTPEYNGSNWQSYVFERIKPLYEQARHVTQAQLDDLKRDPPTLYDEREYALRQRIVELLSAQVALATQPPIAALIESPLGLSDWVEFHTAELRGIRDTLARNQLTSASPRTLGELGQELERLLATPSAEPSAVYSVSRVVNGVTETFDFDVATWRRKLAAASAARILTQVRELGQARPEQALGFFVSEPPTTEPDASAGGQGAQDELPGRYTAAAFARDVAPALDFISTRADALGLPPVEREELDQLYRTAITKYASGYAEALHAYYDSFEFEAGSEEALPFSLSTLGQPSSWFLRFLTTVVTNATPALGDGEYYEIMGKSLSDFRALAELLAPAKGTIPGLAPYQKIIAELALALEPAPAAPADPSGAAPTPTLTDALSASGVITLNKLTGADKDRLAQVTGWLTGANVERSLHAPFLAPVQEVYTYGTSSINRAISAAWSNELWPLLAPVLARFPFRLGAVEDVSVATLEAVLRAQGKQPGSFWLAFQRWLGPVTVQRSGAYQLLRGLTAPSTALPVINDLARLSRALWDEDGNPLPLPLRLTPQPLDASASSGRIPTLAYLRSGSSAVYAFNQRPGSSTLPLQWWDQGVSSVIIKMTRPGTTETTTYSLDEADSPFSFYRLLCRARRPPPTPAQPEPPCRQGRGQRSWDIPLAGSATRAVTLTLDTDPWDLFQIGR